MTVYIACCAQLANRKMVMSDLPPMPSRTSAGFFELEDPDDGTPIKQMINLNDALLFVTERATYEMRLADQIDPMRTNPNLPHNVRRKVFSHGTGSKLLCKTLIFGKVMFRVECLPQLDVKRGLQLSYDAMCEIDAMDKIARNFVGAEQQAIAAAELIKQQSRSPRRRCGFSQRARAADWQGTKCAACAGTGP